MRQILSSVRKNVIPTKQKEKEKIKIANLSLDLVKNEITKYPEVISAEFGGSFAKGTWLAEKADIDIFVKFKESVSEKKFSEIAKKIGFASMKKYKPYVRYSEHPYVEAAIKNTKINIVPCYDVSSGNWKSSADRSPFHTEHMKKALSKSMKNEVRILKTFLRTQEIYGAEIAKQGFSGYVSEVLVLNFGSFENVIKSIATVKENHVVGKAVKKFDTPIVIIDPIDNNRNLMAAVSNENIGKFILLCRSFMNNPSMSFFRMNKSKTLKNWQNVLTVKFAFSKRSPDIIWGQAKKAASSLSTQLNLGGFKVLRYTAHADEKNVHLFFLLESMDISKISVKEGPDFFNIHDTEQFISKNIKKTDLMWINNNRKVVCLVKRANNNAAKFLKALLKSSKKPGIPSGLQKDLKKGFKIFVGGKGLSKSIKEETSDLVSTNETVFYSAKKIKK